MEHLEHDDTVVHEHTHEHTHEHDGVTHTHVHSHPHTHDHDHEEDHHHAHAASGVSGDQTVAVLQYMLEHNIHHAGELNDIASTLTGEAQHQLLHAVESFDQANGYLSAALEILKSK
jgi:hypothetical protein